MPDPETTAYNKANAEAKAKANLLKIKKGVALLVGDEPLGIGAMAKPPQTAFDAQVDGDHYKNLAIQPLYYCEKNGITACASKVIKYATRAFVRMGRGNKTGAKKDIHKAIHCLNYWLETSFEKEPDQCLTPQH